MENSNEVLWFGEKCVAIGRKGMKVCAIIFPILIVGFFFAHIIFKGDFGSFIEAFVFYFAMADGIQAIVVILIYLCIPMFFAFMGLKFYGMKVMGIGQTAVNTSEILLLMKEETKD